MREDAEPDVITGLPQLDDIPWDVLCADDDSVLARLIRRFQVDPRPADDAVAAFNNFI